jgi:hypothetical protein
MQGNDQQTDNGMLLLSFLSVTVSLIRCFCSLIMNCDGVNYFWLGAVLRSGREILLQVILGRKILKETVHARLQIRLL